MSSEVFPSSSNTCPWTSDSSQLRHQDWPTLGDRLARFCRTWSTLLFNVGQHCPNFCRIRPTIAHLDQPFSALGQTRPESVHAGQNWSKAGLAQPNVAKGCSALVEINRLFAKFDHPWSMFARFGSSSANICPTWTRGGHILQTSAKVDNAHRKSPRAMRASIATLRLWFWPTQNQQPRKTGCAILHIVQFAGHGAGGGAQLTLLVRNEGHEHFECRPLFARSLAKPGRGCARSSPGRCVG